MLAIDTNILVRFLVGDDVDQAAKARALFRESRIFIPTTVLLETDWVLRSLYGLKAPEIRSAITAVAGLENVVLESPAAVAQALAGVSAGLDFADALHLAAASACDAFVTFDRRLKSAAPKSDGPSVRLL